MQISDKELRLWREMVSRALDDIDNGNVTKARGRLRHLRDCL